MRVLVPIALLGILCVTAQGSAATRSAVFLADVLGAPVGLIVAPAAVRVTADSFWLAAALGIPLVAAAIIAVAAPLPAGRSLRRRAPALAEAA